MKRSLPADKISICKNLLPARVSVPGIFTLSLILRTLGRSVVAAAMLLSVNVNAQAGNDQKQSDYKKAIKDRSAKIVNVLGITDSNKYQVVLNELMNQYFSLNTIHEHHKKAIAEIKQGSLSKEEAGKEITKLEQEKSSELLQQHARFIDHLKENLSEAQLEKVKDGMTYGVLPLTYAGYQDMLTNLTTEQKQQIYAWLKEARELAMDEGSSDKKHQVFGKYKGKINNYLSAAGYDMKKESKAWEERIKQKQAAQK